ncbi:hypothetical protein CCR94_07890 [Rhodoblastus sphagnicola]|uniref:Uncharacterized protein n=1 Tax=Rhodoblastus sphagnicola TaxID=333368 RepID=A0A2S6NB95_9HYPH|nr:hypothetical protein [Rhodoblastus sphagnicola]MBB4197738.1 hypothetical protein [Rhodoblastus sphagnicola]PPQ31883.1 hypothetical protein CCR94_07890 [Rhodoblastus sphagnicola]
MTVLGQPLTRLAQVASPLSAALLSAALASPAEAGAWTPEAGHGEVIVTTLFDQSNTGFDQAGRFAPTPKYRSYLASVYLDYGLADWLAATIKPSLQSSTLGAPANQKFTGFGDSEIGVRGRVWKSDEAVISVQALAQLPSTAGAANPSLGGSKNADFDLRLLGGKNIAIGALPGFVDVSFGFRARGGKAPNEGRADLSLGVYLWPELMLLAQNFNVVSAPSNDPSHPRWAQAKGELSLVYSLNAEWRAQVGGFATLAGVNAYREYGAVLALWRRF